ncbi:hypothetical protein Bca4012_080282 [Brassica carinata]
MHSSETKVALAEWLRRVPAKYMGFPRESSNFSGDEYLLPSPLFIFSTHLSALSFSLFFQLLIKFPPLQQQWESKASWIASVVAGCSTLPSRSHQGPPSAPRRSFFSHSPPAFLETAKVGPFSLGVNLVKTEGAAALFSGVSATTRMGLYEVPKNKWTDPESGKLSLTRKIAGGDAIRSMAKQEGVMSSWRGSALTINRAMIVTAAQLASYDQFKEKLVESGLMRDGLARWLVSRRGSWRLTRWT